MTVRAAVVATVLSVLSMLALLGPGVHAAPVEVRRADIAGALQTLEHEVASTADIADDTASLDTAFWRKKLVLNGDIVMTVSSYYSRDTRNAWSYYACATSQTEKYLEASAVGDVGNGFVLQVNKVHEGSTAAKKVEGWFLSVMSGLPEDDKYPGYTRLAVTNGRFRATIWQLDDSNNLRVVYSPSAEEASGAYLAIPPGSKRDKFTNYLAVGAASDGAVTVTLEG